MLNNIGWHRAKLGDYSYAADYCRSALAVHEEIGDLNGQAHTWDSLGYINRHLGHHDQAAECYRHALTLFRLTGDFHGEATCFDYLGEMHHAAGETRAARQAWEQALIIFDQLGHPDADQVRAKLDKQDLAGQSPDQQSRITCAT
jgi:tetratricopeptide (TPR) repeat protein